MKLVVLGSNGYRPTDLGQTACYAIPELGVVLDAGTGLYRLADYLQGDQLGDQLDIYLTHAHSDHYGGLVYLEFVFLRMATLKALERESKPKMGTIYESLGEAQPKAWVHAPAEILDDIPDYFRYFRDNKHYEFIPLQAVEEMAGGARITSFPLDHTVTCYGFRLDTPGGSLAYVSDTFCGPDSSYLENIRGVDVLLHECTFPDEEAESARRSGHSHITPVVNMAAEAQVRRLVLVHLHPLRPEWGDPDLERAHVIFPRTELAFDRMEIEF